jgi:Domain of unknown function (DUF222)/HNH endonuclease
MDPREMSANVPETTTTESRAADDEDCYRALQEFAEVQGEMERLAFRRLRLLAKIDRQRLFARDGHLSATAWLASTFRMGWGEAAREVFTALALEEMPLTRAAVEDGAVSTSGLGVLAQVREVDPTAFAADEARLVESARGQSISDLRRDASHWRLDVEREQLRRDPDALRKRRRLHTSVSLLGMTKMDAQMDPEGGASVLTALSAVLDAEAHAGKPDDRAPAQRRADALAEICRQWLDGNDRPEVGLERPHMTLTVDAGSLDTGGKAELDRVGPVGPELMRQLACDASVRRVIWAGGSQPLDVGRRTPVISAALRSALVLRDRHCTFPSCERPSSWCDGHHIVPWLDGGTTDLANLTLLCRRHHREVHSGRFSLESAEGRLVVRRADGSRLEGRAPP